MLGLASVLSAGGVTESKQQQKLVRFEGGGEAETSSQLPQ